MAFNLRAGVERPANLDSLFDYRPLFDESDTVLDAIDDDLCADRQRLPTQRFR